MRDVTRDLAGILEVLHTSDVRELVWQEGDVQVRLHRSHAVPARMAHVPTAEAPAEPEPSDITSALVGTFYRAGKAGDPPLVSEGSQVKPDTVVGIIEALQVLTDVQAGCEGVIASALATDGQPVEYGQVLFQVIPS
ncbi:MAG: acetyl-CoA carboxylase biotin carboxyl carrier protein [Chloroflexota bacterium]